MTEEQLIGKDIVLNVPLKTSVTLGAENNEGFIRATEGQYFNRIHSAEFMSQFSLPPLGSALYASGSTILSLDQEVVGDFSHWRIVPPSFIPVASPVALSGAYSAQEDSTVISLKGDCLEILIDSQPPCVVLSENTPLYSVTFGADRGYFDTVNAYFEKATGKPVQQPLGNLLVALSSAVGNLFDLASLGGSELAELHQKRMQPENPSYPVFSRIDIYLSQEQALVLPHALDYSFAVEKKEKRIPIGPMTAYLTQLSCIQDRQEIFTAIGKMAFMSEQDLLKAMRSRGNS